MSWQWPSLQCPVWWQKTCCGVRPDGAADERGRRTVPSRVVQGDDTAFKALNKAYHDVLDIRAGRAVEADFEDSFETWMKVRAWAGVRPPVQTGRQGWGKAQDSFLPPPRRSRLGEGRSYQTHDQNWPCH